MYQGCQLPVSRPTAHHFLLRSYCVLLVLPCGTASLLILGVHVGRIRPVKFHASWDWHIQVAAHAHNDGLESGSEEIPHRPHRPAVWSFVQDHQASIDEATTTERQHRVRFPCVICDRACGVDSGHAQEIQSQSVRVLGPSSMHSLYAKANAGLLSRRRHVQMSQMRLWMELGLVSSDPGWRFILLAGVDGAAGAVFLQTVESHTVWIIHNSFRWCLLGVTI